MPTTLLGQLLEEAVAGWTAAVGPGHPDTLAAKNNLANLLDDVEEWDDARYTALFDVLPICAHVGRGGRKAAGATSWTGWMRTTTTTLERSGR